MNRCRKFGSAEKRLRTESAVKTTSRYDEGRFIALATRADAEKKTQEQLMRTL
jgi:hypothetical protein